MHLTVSASAYSEISARYPCGIKIKSNAMVDRHLESEKLQHFCYTLWGLGGVGKSHLAHSLAGSAALAFDWKIFTKDSTSLWRNYDGEEIVV